MRSTIAAAVALFVGLGAASAQGMAPTAAPAAKTAKAAKTHAAKMHRYFGHVKNVDATNKKLTVSRGKGKTQAMEDIMLTPEVMLVSTGKKGKNLSVEEVMVGDPVFVYFMGPLKGAHTVKKVAVSKGKAHKHAPKKG